MPLLTNQQSRFLGGGRWLFSDSFGANGALAAPWTGATFVATSGVVVNTPTLDTELLSNGDMETGNPPTGWSTSGSSTLTGAADPRTGSAGAQSLNGQRGSSDTVAYKSTSGGRIGWHRGEGWERNVDSTSVGYLYDLGETAYYASTTWHKTIVTSLIASAGAIVARARSYGSSGQNGRYDDVSLRKMTPSTLFATVNFGLSDFALSGPAMELHPNAQGGIVLCLDSAANPANYIVAYYQYSRQLVTSTVKIVQLVSGTYTTLASATLGYSPNKRFSARKSGNQLWVYWGDDDFTVLVGGAPVTVDASITNNTIHGIFSTAETNTFRGAFRLGRYAALSAPTTVSTCPVVFGGSSITNASPGFRDCIANRLTWNFPATTFTLFNSSASGRTTWNNLLRVQADFIDKSPILITLDNANDDAAGLGRRAVEAFVRRIWTSAPNCKIVFLKVFNVASNLVDANINSPSNAAQQAEFAALAAHYGIPIIPTWDNVATDVNAGKYQLSEYLYDTVHPRMWGHALITGWLDQVVTAAFLSAQQSPAMLPVRLYDNGDLEAVATIKNGNAYDSVTGTWTPSGTTISSSAANSTVTYSGTFASIGRPESDGTVQVSVDGGAYQSITFGPNGKLLASGGAHTVTLKVISGTVTISKFWAI